MAKRRPILAARIRLGQQQRALDGTRHRRALDALDFRDQVVGHLLQAGKTAGLLDRKRPAVALQEAEVFLGETWQQVVEVGIRERGGRRRRGRGLGRRTGRSSRCRAGLPGRDARRRRLNAGDCGGTERGHQTGVEQCPQVVRRCASHQRDPLVAGLAGVDDQQQVARGSRERMDAGTDFVAARISLGVTIGHRCHSLCRRRLGGEVYEAARTPRRRGEQNRSVRDAQPSQASRLDAQFAAQDLADGSLGQIGAELDDARPLVASEIGFAIGPHGGLGHGSVLPDHHQLDRLARVFVGHTDRRAFQHARHQADHLFHLVGVDVEAAHQDHVFLAIDDLEVTALVDGADVAGAKVAVGRHDLGGLVRPLPIAGHHLRAADRDLAGCAHGDLAPFVVEQGQLGRGQRNADGAAVGGARHRVAGRRGRGLRQAVAFADGALRLLEPELGGAAGDGHAAAHREHEVGPVDAVELRVVDHRIEQGVDGRQDVELVLGQFLEHRRQVTRVRDQHVGAADAHRHHHVHREREDVIKRQRTDHRDLLAGRYFLRDRCVPGLDLQHVGDDVAVLEHRALAHAGGAAGVLQHRDVIALERRRLEGAAAALGDGLASFGYGYF